MRNSSETNGRKVFARLAVIGLVSGAVAGCSADVARFADASGPQPPAPEVTGSLGAVPTGRVDTQPLAPPYAAAPGATATSYASPAAGQPLYGTSAYGQPAYGAAVPATRVAAGASHVVQPGETLNSVARHYQISPAALGTANNIAPGMTVRTGQTLIIPPPAPGHLAQAVPAAPAPAPMPRAAAPARPVVAQASPVAPPAPSVRPAPTPAVTRAPAPAPSTSAVAEQPPAAPAPTKTAAVQPKVETAAKVSAVEPEDAPRAAGSGPQFRAPVRGRVIASFGPKPGGAHNDGVNFAVPSGTAVRAAEDGVVAYAGNELKGYGNLVLIKHSDGYVTAYAHASELDVKRGDTVRRGQIIAKAGQSGNVQSPQLHFEIRKGSTAVDPSRYVAGL